MGLEIPHPHLLDTVHLQVHLQLVVQSPPGHRIQTTWQRCSGLSHQDPELEAHRGPQGGQFFPGCPGLRQADGQGGMAPGAQRDGLLPGHKYLPDQLPSASDGDAGGPGA